MDAQRTQGPNPMHVAVRGREYAVYFNDAGKPQTVMVHKKGHQLARLNINGPTARAAITKATGSAA